MFRIRSTHERDASSYKSFVGKSKGKRLYGMPEHRRQNNSKTYLKETRSRDVNWIRLTQDTVLWQEFCEYGNQSSASINGNEFHNQRFDNKLVKDYIP
jgi:hypothetical protein